VFLNDCMNDRIYPDFNNYNHSNPQRLKILCNTLYKHITPLIPLYIGPDVSGSYIADFVQLAAQLSMLFVNESCMMSSSVLEFGTMKCFCCLKSRKLSFAET
jgi:hypothetical protein